MRRRAGARPVLGAARRRRRPARRGHASCVVAHAARSREATSFHAAFAPDAAADGDRRLAALGARRPRRARREPARHRAARAGRAGLRTARCSATRTDDGPLLDGLDARAGRASANAAPTGAATARPSAASPRATSRNAVPAAARLPVSRSSSARRSRATTVDALVRRTSPRPAAGRGARARLLAVGRRVQPRRQPTRPRSRTAPSASCSSTTCGRCRRRRPTRAARVGGALVGARAPAGLGRRRTSNFPDPELADLAPRLPRRGTSSGSLRGQGRLRPRRTSSGSLSRLTA